MPLGTPPGRGVLGRLTTVSIAGKTLHRCHRAARSLWWFARRSTDAPSSPAATRHGRGGRFDATGAHGTCYLATSADAALLEVFQEHFGPGSVLPRSTLAARTVSHVIVPTDAPPVADLADKHSGASGITSALWSVNDRALTQTWADELHGAGHQGLLHPVQHDTTQKLRAVTIFDRASRPTDATPAWGLDWGTPSAVAGDNPRHIDILQTHGINVIDNPEIVVSRD